VGEIDGGEDGKQESFLSVHGAKNVGSSSLFVNLSFGNLSFDVPSHLWAKLLSMKNLWVLLFALPFTAFSQVAFDSSSLPIVVIHTNGQAIPDEPKAMMRMQVIDNGPGKINHLSDPPNHYDGFIGIERRGSSSQDLSDKKPYSIETRNADGSDRAVALLGMPKEADWVFIAPYSDKSLIRDALTFELARRIMPWASRYRFVELMVDTSYQGIYLVAEKIKRDKNRVNISKLELDDLAGDSLTGGYIFKLDKFTGALVDGWESPYPAIAGSPQKPFYQYHFPKPEDIANGQKNYIKTWMNAFEKVMQSPQFADPNNGYSKYLDVESFVDFTLINEIAKNVDGYRLSTFFHKDRDSKDSHLHAGPVWDFNIAYGNANYCTCERYEGWGIDFNDHCGNDYWVIHFWWNKMWDDPAYRLRISQRWKQLRTSTFTDAKVMGLVDSLVGIVQPAQQRNFDRWPILFDWTWPNAFCCGTYDNHVDYLREWLVNRMHWMDNTMQTLYIGEYDTRRYFSAQVFPNPSNGKVNIRYYARYGDPITLRVFDMAGRLVGTEETIPEFNGEGTFVWEHPLPNGVYFYEILFKGQLNTRGQIINVR